MPRFYANWTTAIDRCANQPVKREMLKEGCSLEYRFPPLDQKNVGTWAIDRSIDDANNAVVSYVIRHFAVTDVLALGYWEYILAIGLFALLGLSITVGLVRAYRRSRREARSIAQQRK